MYYDYDRCMWQQPTATFGQTNIYTYSALTYEHANVIRTSETYKQYDITPHHDTTTKRMTSSIIITNQTSQHTLPWRVTKLGCLPVVLHHIYRVPVLLTACDYFRPDWLIGHISSVTNQNPQHASRLQQVVQVGDAGNSNGSPVHAVKRREKAWCCRVMLVSRESIEISIVCWVGMSIERKWSFHQQFVSPLSNDHPHSPLTMSRHSCCAYKGIDKGTGLAPESALHGGTQWAARGVIIARRIWRMTHKPSTDTTMTSTTSEDSVILIVC